MVVMKDPLLKDIARDIKKSLGRFLSITAIIALGVTFFTGVKIAPEDMKKTADKYYDDYNLMDIRIVSTLGLTEDDLKEVEKVEGIDKVIGSYTIDVLAKFDEQEVVLRVHQLPEENGINNIRLIEGRLPEKPWECVIEKGKIGELIVPIGSTIRLESGQEEPLSDYLEYKEFKVVGLVQSPYYLSFQKGSSNIGTGQVKTFIMIPKENFKLDYYTDIYLTVKGAKELNSYDDEYFNIIDPITAQLEEIAKEREVIRYEEIIQEAKEDLEKGKREYFDKKEEVERELADALKGIEDGKEEIAKGERELENREREFYKTIREGKAKLDNAERNLQKGEEEYNLALRTFEENKKLAEEEFKKAEEEIKKGEKGIVELENSITQINMALENLLLPEKEKEKLTVELQTLTKTLEETKESVEIGKREMELKRLELTKGEKELAKTKEWLDSTRKAIEDERQKLIEGERTGLLEIEKARKDLEKAKEEIQKGEKEYIEAKEEVERELGKAWKEIEDAEEEIEDIEKGKWYVLDRNSHYSYVDYGGAADRIDALSQVFPVFFALVSALVCLTTMTRMVDEQRVNIGTLKALGYGKGPIALKYILYALFATLLGCIIGIAIGFTLFPTVIFNAYGIMYMLPPVELHFNPILALSTSLIAIGLTTFTAYISCSNELKETTAALLRPRAPKAGKRILLEKIPLIWNRFNFSWKVTIRNIFRYKRRFFMTVFGVAGCTALILAAFGIRDSIRTVVDRQFGELFTYDIAIGLSFESTEYLEDERILGYELLYKEMGEISFNSTTKDITIIVPEDIDSISRFINLRNRKDKTTIPIPEKGVVITEQVSRSLGIKVGDEIVFRNSENDEERVKIQGIAENYIGNYIYLTKEYYEEIFSEKVKYNEAIGEIKEKTRKFQDKLSKDLLSKEGIYNVSFNTTIKEDFDDTIWSLSYVVLVMIFSAGALAFVVLYNLTNVNISERIREIATIKVLGFYDREVSAYIYRENIILTILGTLAGLVIGIFLHRYIMTTVEMDNLMFGLELEFRSYIISIVLTLGFAALVNMAMYCKLKNVKMVESLKSID
ncbi:ABC transporter permease [Tepidimicrobium xylanilyticum]|uniref:Putative ABC transport system permease protein n=2 Tax=Tepidimicrobium xylanilyticum TaxID=1123352 RepID=A0A1H3C0P1_9FIRM|nr:ABC transporter permease [Tepidimicrobium xylanilyticum]GMG97310.1 ABC transporter permease [Tepidimicrobium xylanilyticum]SDX47611.1 putative ABC transport system permease protein [Tepidimicrobium xylanilyticum]